MLNLVPQLRVQKIIPQTYLSFPGYGTRHDSFAIYHTDKENCKGQVFSISSAKAVLDALKR